MTKKLPTKEEVLQYVRERKEVTNDEMYKEGFGDVERSWDTISKLRELADEGKLELVTGRLYDERGHPVKTIIVWKIKG